MTRQNITIFSAVNSRIAQHRVLKIIHVFRKYAQWGCAPTIWGAFRKVGQHTVGMGACHLVSEGSPRLIECGSLVNFTKGQYLPPVKAL
jgi:hypothetical protein